MNTFLKKATERVPYLWLLLIVLGCMVEILVGAMVIVENRFQHALESAVPMNMLAVFDHYSPPSRSLAVQVVEWPDRLFVYGTRSDPVVLDGWYLDMGDLLARFEQPRAGQKLVFRWTDMVAQDCVRWHPLYPVLCGLRPLPEGQIRSMTLKSTTDWQFYRNLFKEVP
jgi:hypothetical protein